MSHERAIKSDKGVVLAVLPWYPRYYCGNGYKFCSIAAVLGLECRRDANQACSTTVVMGLGLHDLSTDA